MRELVVRDTEPTPRGRRIVRDEHIGADDEVVDDLARLGTFEVERQAAFVAGIDGPAVVRVGNRHAGLKGKVAVGVALAGRLDLDHVGAEVGHDRGGRVCRYEACRIKHLESGKDARLAHRISSSTAETGARASRPRRYASDADDPGPRARSPVPLLPQSLHSDEATLHT